MESKGLKELKDIERVCRDSDFHTDYYKRKLDVVENELKEGLEYKSIVETLKKQYQFFVKEEFYDGETHYFLYINNAITPNRIISKQEAEFIQKHLVDEKFK